MTTTVSCCEQRVRPSICPARLSRFLSFPPPPRAKSHRRQPLCPERPPLQGPTEKERFLKLSSDHLPAHLSHTMASRSRRRQPAPPPAPPTQMHLDRPSAQDIYEQVADNARQELGRSGVSLFFSG